MCCIPAQHAGVGPERIFTNATEPAFNHVGRWSARPHAVGQTHAGGRQLHRRRIPTPKPGTSGGKTLREGTAKGRGRRAWSCMAAKMAQWALGGSAQRLKSHFLVGLLRPEAGLTIARQVGWRRYLLNIRILAKESILSPACPLVPGSPLRMAALPPRTDWPS